MGFGNVDIFHSDVSDMEESNAGDMDQYKNYPSEGYRSFGGKYDFHEDYNGLVR